MPIKVLLADDMPVVRRAIRGLLEYEPGLEVVGEAADFGQTVQMARELKPQVVILDLHMPDEDKFTPPDIKSHLSDAASRLVAISAWNDQDAKALAESFGAVTLLDKVDLGNTLIPAITRMAYNKRFFAIGNRSKA
jgi:DNA-binding NarL/FixJ family response regulator